MRSLPRCCRGLGAEWVRTYQLVRLNEADYTIGTTGMPRHSKVGRPLDFRASLGMLQGNFELSVKRSAGLFFPYFINRPEDSVRCCRAQSRTRLARGPAGWH